MKKATFILTLIVALLLVGCGGTSSNSVGISSADFEEVRQQVSDLTTGQEEMSASLSETKETMETVQSSLEEVNSALSRINSLIEDDIALQNNPDKSSSSSNNQTSSSGGFKISCAYNNEFFSIEPRTEAEKQKCIDSPYKLPYEMGSGRIRDLTFIFSGEDLQNIYRVDESFNHMEGLSYSPQVNGLKCVYFNMEDGGGDYYFEVITSNNTYYFSVRY